MSKIKPFWRIVIGFLLLLAVVYSSNMLSFGGSFVGFAVWVAGLIVYIYFAIKVPYDDPLRSMRDLIAQQNEQNRTQQADVKPDPHPTAADGEYTPEIRMIIQAGQKMSEDKQKEMLRVLKAIFPAEFKNE